MRRVFLSFVAEDLDWVNFFRGQIKNPNNPLDISDFSVKIPFNSADAEYIRRKILEMIRNVSVLACLIGDLTHTSKWVTWEIEMANEFDKGIVGIRLHSNATRDKLPPALQCYCDYIVN